jgi:uncharacterized membrane protein YhaH (DUF805 family)
MGMVFCRGCGKEIHETAPTCPHCGAPQNILRTPSAQMKDRSNESPLDWYLEVLKKYAVFSGRARRKEYWYFALFSTLITIGLIIIDNVTGTFSEEAGMGLLGGIYTLGILIPSIAVIVRRLHDTSRSGWWFWIALIPIIGAIVLFVFLVSDSKPEENQYGPSPKAF